ncbi:MAG TPA: hypothetical protein VM616_04270 [Gammaproteobacteria bacterium]|nr:hypothetical protein [Gammaproteobacteria bacterium]
MARFLLLVHGHHFKPAADTLAALWLEAIRWGLLRDAPAALDRFERVEHRLAWFGDCTNRLLRDSGRDYDEALDVADRCNALSALKQLDQARKFRRARYEKLPGKTSLKEFLADAGAPLLRALRLSEHVASSVLPEFAAYWRAGDGYRAEVQERIAEPLLAALDRGDDVMVLSHCLGSVIVYDVLWQLSRGAAAGDAPAPKVNVWVTFGSPLGDESVKSRLNGADRSGAERYPANVLNWYNVSAEDDYLAHDEALANDYAAMLEHRLISRIQDISIYNLCVRYGRSNPHSASGYLIHPRITRLITDWLCADQLIPGMPA